MTPEPNATPDTMRPVHIHCGAGKLGLGAVLPCINPDFDLIVVAVSRKSRGDASADDDYVDWDALSGNARVWLANSAKGVAPFGRYFRCVRARLGAVVTMKTVQSVPGEPVLLVVDTLHQICELLNHASSLTCSLGNTQKSLVECLRRVDRAAKVPVLAFENQLSMEGFEKSSESWQVHHVITDRICSRRVRGPESVTVKCEDYLSVVVSRTVRGIFDPQVCGSVTFIEPEQLGFYAMRKRLLVNSVHYVFALFCVELIIEEGLHQRDQFLKMLVPHLERKPKYVHAQNVYCGIQALRLMWPLFTEPDSEDAKALTKCYGAVAPQELFDVMIHEMKEVQVRMIKPADTVGRLIDPANLRKELRKWKEHQREPIEFVRKYEHHIKQLPLYDKPSVEDMKALESVLSDAFVGLSDYLLT